ncbi:sensor histidine kinase [Cumulibacter soli]|uniref:sensor histidine kinase n=1 Tax=Cumulibacter soli TaxID=2546344 RepID=UPI001067C047|nr:histidine kinase [Cumulibacter soli]
MSTSTKSRQRSFFERLTSADENSSAAAATRPAATSTSAPRKPIAQQIRLGALIAVAIVLYAVQAPVLGAAYGLGAWGMLLALPGSVGVVLAHYNPRAAVGVVLLGTVLITFALLPNGLFSDGAAVYALPVPWTVCSMLALFACTLLLGYSVPLRDAAITYGAMILVSLALEVLAGGFTGAFFVAAWVSLVLGAIGLGIRQLRASEARAKQHKQISEQEREQREMLQEKAQVARELHDVVAHHMSVITVQASSAEYRIPNLPDEVRREFQEISEQSRSSLAELRRILGVLRGDEAQAERAPQPGVEDLPRVIEHVGRAGTKVDFVSADLSDLERSVSIATYRIVQESLSNVVRHAAGSPARVVIERSIGSVEISVRNPAPQHPVNPMPGSGHGLRGMRERAVALGGTLATGQTADGGFEVLAWLPTSAENAEAWELDLQGNT